MAMFMNLGSHNGQCFSKTLIGFIELPHRPEDHAKVIECHVVIRV
jgi:hypothetical protein